MNRIQALIFDVDGTLADSERCGHRVAFDQAFDEAGLEWHCSEEVCGELLTVTGGKERMRHCVEAHARPEKDRADLETLIRGPHSLLRFASPAQPSLLSVKMRPNWNGTGE